MHFLFSQGSVLHVSEILRPASSRITLYNSSVDNKRHIIITTSEVKQSYLRRKHSVFARQCMCQYDEVCILRVSCASGALGVPANANGPSLQSMLLQTMVIGFNTAPRYFKIECWEGSERISKAWQVMLCLEAVRIFGCLDPKLSWPIRVLYLLVTVRPVSCRFHHQWEINENLD